MHGRATLITIAVSVLALFQCEVFLSDYGAEDQPCFGDGTCNEGHVCTPDELCCMQDCAGKRCDDDDGCGGICGCPDGHVCMQDGECCEQDCDGKGCDDTDGCGGTCGCPEGHVCMHDGECCEQDCDGKACDDADGCGGTCGCPEGYECISGSCEQLLPGPEVAFSPMDLTSAKSRLPHVHGCPQSLLIRRNMLSMLLQAEHLSFDCIPGHGLGDILTPCGWWSPIFGQPSISRAN